MVTPGRVTRRGERCCIPPRESKNQPGRCARPCRHPQRGRYRARAISASQGRYRHRDADRQCRYRARQGCDQRSAWVMDLNNNVSRMMPAAPGRSTQRVQALFVRQDLGAGPRHRAQAPSREPAAPRRQRQEAVMRAAMRHPPSSYCRAGWLGQGPGEDRALSPTNRGSRRPRPRQELQSAARFCATSAWRCSAASRRSARPNGAAQTTCFYIITAHRRRYRDGRARRQDITDLPCIAGRASASAICRRRHRSSAADGGRTSRAILEVSEQLSRGLGRRCSTRSWRVLDQPSAARFGDALSGGERRRCEIARALRPSRTHPAR